MGFFSTWLRESYFPWQDLVNTPIVSEQMAACYVMARLPCVVALAKAVPSNTM